MRLDPPALNILQKQYIGLCELDRQLVETVTFYDLAVTNVSMHPRHNLGLVVPRRGR